MENVPTGAICAADAMRQDRASLKVGINCLKLHEALQCESEDFPVQQLHLQLYSNNCHLKCVHCNVNIDAEF